MKAFLVISQCLPACRVLIIGFEGIVEGFLVVQMKHAAAAAVFFLRRLGQLHSEALKRQTFWSHLVLKKRKKNNEMSNFAESKSVCTAL